MEDTTTPRKNSPHKPNSLHIFRLGVVFAIAAVVIGMFSLAPQQASAAAVAAQCNDEMNGGGTEVACTVTVVNYLTAAGALAASPASTLTMTRCVGATGPVSTLTCATTVSTLSEPVASVRQCNGSGNGGGGAVVCTVTVSNHFTGSPAVVTAAKIYQCIGSVITGTGAPGTCTPANTAGITSVPAATVGQCNGSGNGGTSVGFICSVSGSSTMTATFPLNVDQCNGSGNGGGALVTCQASVTNQVLPATATATASASSTATATASASPSSSPTGTTTGTPPVTSTVATPSPTVPVATSTPVLSTPTKTPVGASPSVAPAPPATGNTDVAGGAGSSWGASWAFGLGAFFVALIGYAFISRRIAHR